MSDIIVETAKLGTRCQMVLPAKIRKAAGLSEGDEVLVAKSRNTMTIVPKPKSYAHHLLGPTALHSLTMLACPHKLTGYK